MGSLNLIIEKQVKHILFILSILLLSSPLFGQSERPEAIIIPVSGIGDVTNTRKLILQNTLEDELKSHFRLVLKEKYQEVLEKVVEELEFEECNKDQCILRVQEILQVENVIHLQVIGEGSDTQLILNWRTLDEKRKEEVFCEDCGTGDLRKMISGLVDKLVGGTNKVVIPKRDKEEIKYEKKTAEKLEKLVEVEKDAKEFLIQVTASGIGEGLSLVYYYSDKISFGFDSLYRKEELSGTFISSSGTQNAILIRERSTSLIYGRYHLFSGSFYMQFGIVNRDWLIEAQYKSTSNNKNTVKYIATYPDSTTIVGIGWNWIADIGFSFSLGVSYIPTKPDYEYVEENDYYISESKKELWENYVNENTLETPAFIKLGWIF